MSVGGERVAYGVLGMTGIAVKTFVGRSGVTPPHPLKLNTTCKLLITFTLQSLFPPDHSRGIHRKDGGFPSMAERLEEEKYLPLFPGTEPRIVEPLA